MHVRVRAAAARRGASVFAQFALAGNCSVKQASKFSRQHTRVLPASYKVFLSSGDRAMQEYVGIMGGAARRSHLRARGSAPMN
jgi:hypothetical protein